MKYVVFHHAAENVLERAPRHMPAHVERIREFQARGAPLMIGVFGDPQEEGSMTIFTDRDAAEEFVTGDPFVRAGIVRSWEIREWNELLTQEARDAGHPAPGAGRSRHPVRAT